MPIAEAGMSNMLKISEFKASSPASGLSSRDRGLLRPNPLADTMTRRFPKEAPFDLPGIAARGDAAMGERRRVPPQCGSPPTTSRFVFFEGPPSANGKPGIHHVMARALKDIFCRYQTLKGKRVERKAGWDTHGLPVELGVEKALGITKEDIGKKISVEEYNTACRSRSCATPRSGTT